MKEVKLGGSKDSGCETSREKLLESRNEGQVTDLPTK